MDQFDALIEGAPTHAEQQQALAAALRRQNLLGQMASVTGGSFAPIGHQLQSSSLAGAQDISHERARQAAQAQALQFHQDELAHQQALEKHGQDQLAEEVRYHNQSDARARELAANQERMRRDLADQNNQARVDLARERAELAAHGGKPIPSALAKPIDQLRDSLEGVTDAKGSFNPAYSGTGFPGGRGVKNWLATHTPGMASKQMEDANNWWQNYGRQFTLDEMHRLYGARLSPQEMSIFEQYHISPDMDAPTIQRNLGQIQNFLAKKYNHHLDNADAAGYNKDQINEYRTSLPQSGSGREAKPGDQYVLGAYQARTQPPAAAAPTGALPLSTGATAPQPQPGPLQGVIQGLPYVPGQSSILQPAQ